MTRHPLLALHVRMRQARSGLGLALALALGGCLQATGDFGRPQRGFLEDKVLPLGGTVSAKLRGEPASFYALTEDEKDLRNRAWRFLTGESNGPVLTQYQDHYAYHRVLPPRSFDVTLYHRSIMGGPHLGAIVGDSPTARALIGPGDFRSLTSRYNRVRDSISTDHALIPYFKLVAAQVRQADHVRIRALERVGNLSEEQKNEAIARVCENALIVARVHWAFHDRAEMYRYSLEHLLVEGPEREAIPAERTLMAFENDLGRFRKEGGIIPPGCLAPVDLPPVIEARPLVRKY
jgi:hypothetical protein